MLRLELPLPDPLLSPNARVHWAPKAKAVIEAKDAVQKPLPKRKWTDIEIQSLKKLYLGTEDAYINLAGFAASINRLPSNVSTKARSLGLATSFLRTKRRKPVDELSDSYRQRLEWESLTKEQKHQRRSARTKKAIKEHGHSRGYREVRFCESCNKFFDVRHSSKQRFCCRRCSTRERSMDNRYTNARGGKRQDLDNIYFRSRWEANYARYLNFLIEHQSHPIIERWEFETDTFEFHKIRRGVRFYTPDFKVFFADGHIEYHEVKGWDYPRGKTARKRFTKYYPNLQLEVIDADFFKALNRQGLKGLIPEWE